MNKRKRRIGDRSDGYLLKKIDPMIKIMPFIMRYRSDAMNMFSSSIDITAAEEYIRQKHAEGYDHFGLVHLLIAAYVRAASQLPAINRFVSGQRVYARNKIEVAITIKREMSLQSPETCLKMIFEPTASPVDVYNIFNEKVQEYRKNQEESDFDKTARILNYIPRFLMKFAIFLLRVLDYFGILPKFLLNVSPFHASLVITSMGSLGIPPIFHHIYDFGNVPLFISFGKRRKGYHVNSDGKVEEKIYSDICVVTDERICDGFYYAASFKMLQRLMRNPWKMDTPPESVIDDIG